MTRGLFESFGAWWQREGLAESGRKYQQEQREKVALWAVDGHCASCEYWYCEYGTSGPCAAAVVHSPECDQGCGTWEKRNPARTDPFSRQAQEKAKTLFATLANGCRVNCSHLGVYTRGVTRGTVDHITFGEGTRITFAIKRDDGTIVLWTEGAGYHRDFEIRPSDAMYSFSENKYRFPGGVEVGHVYIDLPAKDLGLFVSRPDNWVIPPPMWYEKEDK
jgi:hypothetical protein